MLDAMTDQQRFIKSATGRKLCGVAGGIAHHYLVDPTPVRPGFVLTALCAGGGILLYLVACVVMPPAVSDIPDDDHHPQTVSNDTP